MATYHEAYLGIVYLYATLSNDATLMSLCPGGVWRGIADPGTATPFVVIALQAGTDTTTLNGVRVFSDYMYQVKVVSPSNADDTAHSAAAQVDRLLGGPPGRPASGPIILNGATVGQTLACYRQSPLFMDDPPVSGEVFTNIGGLYRLEIQQIAT